MVSVFISAMNQNTFEIYFWRLISLAGSVLTNSGGTVASQPSYMAEPSVTVTNKTDHKIRTTSLSSLSSTGTGGRGWFPR